MLHVAFAAFAVWQLSRQRRTHGLALFPTCPSLKAKHLKSEFKVTRDGPYASALRIRDTLYDRLIGSPPRMHRTSLTEIVTQFA